MTATIRPTLYKLTLTCGHTQLTSRPLPVGHGYPCWTACNVESPEARTVASSEVYDAAAGNEAFIIHPGASNGDMLHVARLVDEANTLPDFSPDEDYWDDETDEVDENLTAAARVTEASHLSPDALDGFLKSIERAAAYRMYQVAATMTEGVSDPTLKQKLNWISLSAKARAADNI